MRRTFIGFICGLSLWFLTGVGAFAAERVLVFAAASTTDAINKASQLFERESGIKVIASFAGSGALAKQVIAGAPADLYLSANVKWMDHAEANGGIDADSRQNLLANRLVLITPKDAPPITLKTLSTDLAGHRLAMGDPDHVPAGIYGKQALETLGLWKDVAQSIARMPNVRSALTLVDRGEAAAGIVYRTDAPIAPNTRISDTFPADSHAPIVYPIALTTKGAQTPEARQFLQFLTGEKARALFAKYGFSSPAQP